MTTDSLINEEERAEMGLVNCSKVYVGNSKYG